MTIHLKEYTKHCNCPSVFLFFFPKLCKTQSIFIMIDYIVNY